MLDLHFSNRLIFSSFVPNLNIEAELLVPEAELSSDSLRPETRKSFTVSHLSTDTSICNEADAARQLSS